MRPRFSLALALPSAFILSGCHRSDKPEGPLATARTFLEAAAQGRRKAVFQLLAPPSRKSLQLLLAKLPRDGATLDPWELIFPEAGFSAPLRADLLDTDKDGARVLVRPDPRWLSFWPAGPWTACWARMALPVRSGVVGWVTWPALGLSLSVWPERVPRRTVLRLVRSRKSWQVLLPAAAQPASE